MDICFYWMKESIKQKYLFVYWITGSQNMGDFSQNITHHITLEKFVLLICIWQIPYLTLTIRSCKNGKILYSLQTIRL